MCSGQDVCAIDRNCCLECHFAWEERIVAPYLPLHFRARLLQEHEWLRENGFPQPQIGIHAAWEDAAFVAYLPAEVYALLRADHAAHERGALRSRAGR